MTRRDDPPLLPEAFASSLSSEDPNPRSEGSDQGTRLRKERATLRSQCHLAHGAVDQRHAERSFQPLHPGADPRLRQMQLTSSRRESVAVDDRQKGRDLRYRHRRHAELDQQVVSHDDKGEGKGTGSTASWRPGVDIFQPSVVSHQLSVVTAATASISTTAPGTANPSTIATVMTGAGTMVARRSAAEANPS